MEKYHIGFKVDYLTIISEPITEKKFKINRFRTNKYYQCKCDCGNIVTRAQTTLRYNKNNIRHCGCKSRLEIIPQSVIKGFKIIKETESHIQPDGNVVRKVDVVCPHCHNIFNVSIYSITRKNVKTISCGCLKPILINKPTNKIEYHGHTSRDLNKFNGKHKSPEYSTWLAMKQRCYNPKHSRYSAYGGRGIIICDKWKNSFISFFEYIGPKPSPNHSIDRIDVNGNYEPGNCRWATEEIQNANKRSQKGQKRVKVEIGDRFENLTIIDEAENYIFKGGVKSSRRFKVRCDCGNELITYLSVLTRGLKKRCAQCSHDKRWEQTKI